VDEELVAVIGRRSRPKGAGMDLRLRGGCARLSISSPAIAKAKQQKDRKRRRERVNQNGLEATEPAGSDALSWCSRRMIQISPASFAFPGVSTGTLCRYQSDFAEAVGAHRE
jgi:hypothetical protein